MASLLSRLAPFVITLRGSKRGFSSAARTLAKVERLRRHPKPFEPAGSDRIEISRYEFGGWPVFDIAPRGVPVAAHALYLHGGCYVFEIDPAHWRFITKLAIEAQVRVVVPIMPLAPVATASVVVSRVADLAASITAQVGGERVSVIGDSSGGGMALAVAMELRDRGVRPLHSTSLIAPWLDISGTDPMLAVISPTDPWLAVPGTHAAGALYRGDLPESDWRVSPIHGSLDGLGPLTMFSGTRDILNADATRLVALAAAAHLPLDYHEGAGMIHNYPILPMPEGDAARKVIAAAIR